LFLKPRLGLVSVAAVMAFIVGVLVMIIGITRDSSMTLPNLSITSLCLVSGASYEVDVSRFRCRRAYALDMLAERGRCSHRPPNLYQENRDLVNSLQLDSQRNGSVE
jgi:hypothetical protein